MAKIWARGSQWHPILVGLAAAFAASLSWLQWGRPYLEHDDWDMLLPNGPYFVVDHVQRVLHEGRWLNYWWWLVGSTHLTPRGAVILFAIGWMLVVAVIVRALDIGWWSVPTMVALYAAPMVSEISSWPATLAAPIWALAATLAGLWLTRRQLLPHLIVLALGTVVVVLGYPTIALFELAMLVVLHHRQSWKRLLAIAATFAAAYVAGLILVFTLNEARFGIFSVQINASRKPSSLNSLAALGRHLKIAGNDWQQWLAHDVIPLVAMGIILLLILREASLRRRVIVLVAAFVAGMVLCSASTITDGVSTPYRAMGWTWPFVVIAVVWGLAALRPHMRILTAAALAVVAVWSTAYWANGALVRYHHAGVIDSTAAQLVTYHDQWPTRQILYVMPTAPITPPEFQTMALLANRLAWEKGIWPAHECLHCTATATFIVEHRLEDQAVFLWHRRIVVNFPDWLTKWVEMTPPHWVEPLG